jgi:probable rRNA maturation factor
LVEVSFEGPASDDPELEDHLVRAVEAALDAGGGAAGSISVTLLDDAGIARLNREYLDHDGATDVISFALHTPGEEPLGDVFIGYDQALRQAGEHGVAARDELARLAIHGTLHVLGYDHPEGEERFECEMWQLQEQVLKSLSTR